MTSTWRFVAAAVFAALLAPGCVSIKEPLVKLNAGDLDGGGSKPDTRVKSTDSDEVRQLKQEIGRLERQAADLREDAAREKAKRKKAEDERDRAKDQAEDLEDRIKDLQKQLDKALRRT